MNGAPARPIESDTSALQPEDFFQALADSTRLRCLVLIATHDELCVCELVHALDLSQPKISRHLKLLRDAGIVGDRRERIWVHYRIAKNLSTWARQVIATTVAANVESSPFADDALQLATMPDRPSERCAN
ncbi:metalloregulator ArsR/SmtB family transcription factor [Salinisphaera sp. T31B1]|uniref:metalloregulator ArsR/SmtB family transcription factor n=1 Tax=Salinisphaera sp. T31B1 TaxID=727963 RepID=UPI00333FA915